MKELKKVIAALLLVGLFAGVGASLKIKRPTQFAIDPPSFHPTVITQNA